MNEYKIEYECEDGFKGEEVVYAANRMMAFEMFEEFGIEGVVKADCFRVVNEHENEGLEDMVSSAEEKATREIR